MSKILVVDDEAPVRLLLGQILERKGYDFETAEDATEARAHLQSETFELILTDIGLPGESGLDLAQDVLSEFPDMAVLMVTAVDDPSVAKAVLEAGAYGYLIKPIERNELLINISNALHRRQLEIENRLYRDQLEQLVAVRTESLRESEQRYRTILESIDEGYFELDLEGNLTFFNESLTRISGYPENRLIASNYREYVTSESNEKIANILKEIYHTGKPVKNVECEVVAGDGTKKFASFSVSPIKNTEDQPIGFRGIARDVTERKVLEMNLSHSQKLESIGQLAAGIAHEINTPTQYVGDNTRFLKDTFGDLHRLLDKYADLVDAATEDGLREDLIREVKEVAEQIDVPYLTEEIPRAIEQSLEGVERISKIVRSMKEFSHPGTEDKTAVDINKAIESTVTVARNEWKYVAEMVTEFDPSLPLVPCLPGDFNQVVLNMIINAAHAISDVVGDGSNGKGNIKVSTQHIGNWAEIRISDTGTGITEEVRSKIFDPFFTTKEVGKGTGQGLAISRSVIVDKHNGTLDFETEVGKGTTFIIKLPIDEGAV